MRIKPTDASESARTSSPGLASVSVPTADKGHHAVSLALSGASRVLAAALARVLPELGGLRVRDVLTAADRALLARAAELADTSGTDPDQVRRLVMDLVAFRARTLLARSTDGGRDARRTLAFAFHDPRHEDDPDGSATPPDEGKLSLPTLSARDERLARTILSSLPPRGSPLPPDFVEALLDPDGPGTATVDLGFLRELVVALSPGQAGLSREEAPGPFDRRDARGMLAKALAALALPRAALTPVTAHQAAAGQALFRERLPDVMKRAVSDWVALHSARASKQSLSSLLASMTRAVVGPQPGANEEHGAFEAPSPASLRGASSPADALSREDRSLLKLLYAVASGRVQELSDVDEVAGALVTLRMTERLAGPRAEADAAALRAPHERQGTAEASPRTTGLSQQEDAEPPDARAKPASAMIAARSGLAASIVVRSEAASSYSLPSAPSTLDEREGAALATSPWSRSFGSTSQMAARLASTYGQAGGQEPTPRLPEAELPSAPLPGSAEAAEAELSLASATTSLDLASALGLGSLFGEVYRASLRARRRRTLLLRRGSTRPSIGRARPAPRLEGSDEEPPFEPPPRRRRASR